MGKRIDGAELYRRFTARGLIYGPAFQGIAEAWAGKDEALGRIAVPAAVAAEIGEYHMHPALLDSCLQVTLATVADQPDEDGQGVFVPSKAERIRYYGSGERIAWCHVTVLHSGARSIVIRALVLGNDGATIAEIDGLRLHRVDLGGGGEIPGLSVALPTPASGARRGWCRPAAAAGASAILCPGKQPRRRAR